MKKIFAVLVLSFCFAASGIHSAWAWGRVGHETVADIASDILDKNLDKKTKDAIAAILKNYQGNDGSLASISTWADELRNQARNHKVIAPPCTFNTANICDDTYSDKTASKWHFIDIDAGTDLTESDEQNYWNNGNNVVNQIEVDKRILSDPATSQDEKYLALKFLVHFMGDVHQPLHCAEKNNDHGGNGVTIRFFAPKGSATGKKMPLHSLWDELIQAWPSSQTPQDIDAAATSLSGDLEKKITDSDKTQWVTGTTTDWAWESYQIAKNTIYADLANEPAGGTNGIPLSKDYDTRMRPFVDTQLEKAGVRLAYLLKTTLGGGLISPTSVTTPKPKKSPTPTKTITPKPSKTPTSTGQVKVTKATANVYKKADSTSAVLKVVNHDDILNTVSSWHGAKYFEVKVDGKNGFIYKGNVEVQ